MAFPKQEYWSGLPFPSPGCLLNPGIQPRSPALAGRFFTSQPPAAAAKLLQLCPTLRPHRRQPTRLPHPWDSPGKNTGVGCHFLLQCVKVKSLSRVRLLATPWTAAHQAPPSMGFARQQYWSVSPVPFPLSQLGSPNYIHM